MEKLFRIGEIAELLQVQSSKLRFWEQQGLLRLERNDENNYRQYSLFDLLHITDIIFYRNLHFSTKELRRLFQLSAPALDQELAGKQQEIELQLAALQQTKQEIELRRSHLQEAARLEQQPYQRGVPDFQQVRLFHEEKQADWQCGLLDQGVYAWVQADVHAEPLYGVLAEADRPEDLIWQWQPYQQYVEVLLQFTVEASPDSNVQEHCSHLEQMGWQTGCIVSRYLFSAQEDGVAYDYYKGWIEILPRER